MFWLNLEEAQPQTAPLTKPSLDEEWLLWLAIKFLQSFLDARALFPFNEVKGFGFAPEQSK
jgi:hypothetical protein